MSDYVIIFIGQFVGVAAGFYAGRFYEKNLLARFLAEHAVVVSRDEYEKIKREREENGNECDD